MECPALPPLAGAAATSSSDRPSRSGARVHVVDVEVEAEAAAAGNEAVAPEATALVASQFAAASASTSMPAVGNEGGDEEGGDTEEASRARRRLRPCCHRDPPYRGNREALGWAVDAVPRGAALMGAAVFVSTALLNLAKEAAGCDTGPNAEECDGKVYGMRPTSLLTNISLIVGLVCAVLMPLVGSIVDHTRYRRAVGRISGAALSVMVLLQVFISSDTWFVIAISQVFLAFSYSVHLCVVLAYLPELTEDKKELMRWNASFTVSQYLSSVAFLVLMVGVISAAGFGDDSVKSARVSQGVVFALCATFFGYAWTRLFRPREASQEVPEGSTLLTAGFRKIGRTSRVIWSHHRAIKWCLLAVSLSEAAVAAFVTIGITFMTDQLQFNSADNGIAILILLVSSIPGTRIATFVSNRWNPIRSFQLCLVVWVINTSVAVAVLQGPGQQTATYCFAVVWGMVTGWVYPTERSLYCAIIPKGQDGELMGMYLCSCQIFSWLPPLVFTAMNEAGISMRAGVASLNIFFALSFCVLFLVGSYDRAVEHAKNFTRGSAQPRSVQATVGDTDGKGRGEILPSCVEAQVDAATSHSNCQVKAESAPTSSEGGYQDDDDLDVHFADGLAEASEPDFGAALKDRSFSDDARFDDEPDQLPSPQLPDNR